jgi:hypothetical protein
VLLGDALRAASLLSLGLAVVEVVEKGAGIWHGRAI